jgi:hypothetical protein
MIDGADSDCGGDCVFGINLDSIILPCTDFLAVGQECSGDPFFSSGQFCVASGRCIFCSGQQTRCFAVFQNGNVFCVAQADCGNGVVETGEECDPPGAVVLCPEETANLAICGNDCQVPPCA